MSKYYSLHVTNTLPPTETKPTRRGNWRIMGWYPTESDVDEAVERLAKEPLGLTRWMIFFHRNQKADGVMIHSDGIFVPVEDYQEVA